MKNVKPITPQEAQALSSGIYAIRPEMLAAVNQLIAKKLNGNTAVFTKDEVIEEYFRQNPADYDNKQQIKNSLYEKKQFDFENEYRKTGWKVVYDGPGYNESYAPTYTFTIKK